MKTAIYAKENVLDIMGIIDSMNVIPQDLGFVPNAYNEAEKCLVETITRYRNGETDFEGTLDFWFGKYADTMNTDNIMMKVGVIAGREATIKALTLNPILKEEKTHYVREVVTHILSGNESCIGAGILNGMSCIVDGRVYKSLISALKKNPEGIVESISEIDSKAFGVGFVLFASQLF